MQKFFRCVAVLSSPVWMATLPGFGAEAVGSVVDWPVSVEAPSEVQEVARAVGFGRVTSAQLSASDGAEDDQFGRAVAISETVGARTTVVVGAGLDDDNGAESGSVYVFEEPAAGWAGSLTEVAKLVPSGPATRFGEITLAIDGETIVVGAWATAYVFTKPPTGWAGTLAEDAVLKASDAMTEDSFGRYSVALSGSTVVVGRREAFDNGSNSGKAYVFERPAAGWSGTLTEDARLFPSDGAAGDFFGKVSIDGEVIVVGASLADAAGTDSGAAYVFERPAGGWAGNLFEDARLLPTTAASDDRFGFAPAVEGSVIAVGAFGAESSGAAYVFIEPALGWSGTVSEVAKLLPSDGASGDSFGQAVAAAGGRIAVGAPQDDDFGTSTGSVYVFEEPAGGWASGGVSTVLEQAKLLAPNGAVGDSLGTSVGLSSGAVVSGAHRDDDGFPDRGSAFVFSSDAIFADNFELGSTAAWSSDVP